MVSVFSDLVHLAHGHLVHISKRLDHIARVFVLELRLAYSPSNFLLGTHSHARLVIAESLNHLMASKLLFQVVGLV